MKILFPIAALVLFFAVGVSAQTNTLSDAEIQGRQLAQQILEQNPSANFTNSGVLKIRDANTNHSDVPVRFETEVNSKGWQTSYIATFSEEGSQDWTIRCKILKIEHSMWLPNHYEITDWSEHGIKSNGVAVSIFEVDENKKFVKQSSTVSSVTSSLEKNDLFTPFANSDFSVADLGLEFFHWPAQKILPKTPKMPSLKLGREYTLLESTNPNPPTNGYSRVLSWIDKESGGILAAEAYDAKGEKLKEFWPKSAGKVNGQWQVEEIEIRNVQTDSRTRLVFVLKK